MHLRFEAILVGAGVRGSEFIFDAQYTVVADTLLGPLSANKARASEEVIGLNNIMPEPV
jgi:hypothetical protein